MATVGTRPSMMMTLLPLSRTARTGRASGRSFFPVQLALLAADVVLIQLALVGAFWIRIYTPILGIPNEHELGIDHAWTLVLVTALLLYIYRSKGLYRAVVFSQRIQQSAIILKAVTIAMAFLMSVTFMTKTHAFVERRSILAIAWCLLVASEIVVRCAFFPPLVRRCLSKRPSIVVGTGDCARQLIRRFSSEGYRDGIQLVGLVTTAPVNGVASIQNVPVVGDIASLEEVVEERGIQEIFVADLALGPERTLELIARCRRLGVAIRVVSGLFEPIYPRIETENLGTIPLVRLRRRPFQRLGLLAKRGIDVLGSGLGLLLISPAFLCIAACIKFTSRGPVFFVQKRAGRDGQEFRFLKFRTMRVGNDDSKHRDFMNRYINGDDVGQTCQRTETRINKIVGDDRVTWIGKFLRRYSLDELPQLINIVRGDMSLVGPRPPIIYEVAMYRDWHKRRLEVVPGLTGLWQVSGRNKLSFEEMVLLDLYYVENWSLALDLRILARTVPAVLFEKTVY